MSLLRDLPAYVVTRRTRHLIYVECREVAIGLSHSSSEEGETKFQQFILIWFWNDNMGRNESVASILQVSRSRSLFFFFRIIRREWETRVPILQVGAGCFRVWKAANNAKKDGGTDLLLVDGALVGEAVGILVAVVASIGFCRSRLARADLPSSSSHSFLAFFS
jgi:hypothetical protein